MDLRPRALIQRLNSSMTATEPDDTHETGTEPVATIPAQPVRGGGRLPDWWEPKRDVVDVDDDVTKEDPEENADEGEERSADDEDLDDVESDEDEDGEGDSGEKYEKKPAPGRRRRGLHGSGKRMYSRPTYGKSRSPKQSLLEAWAGMRPTTRHGLYNGTALALGFGLGVPQFFTAETAYLVATHDSWTDFYVCVWYGVAVAIWMLDQRTRNWLPVFALIARVPLVSVIVGVLLYGTPA
ncbi:hypothetical protein [Streptomyces sp. NBC_01727]|uniref:hypothetical protein n=1 Tax=Streptomyces sp. NBC_01727 TaxID=2975924 RepID=UPI002E0DA214|nr:hypothetical protein OIE76_07475 [Streptomyces sp. NBC_01727]